MNNSLINSNHYTIKVIMYEINLYINVVKPNCSCSSIQLYVVKVASIRTYF